MPAPATLLTTIDSPTTDHRLAVFLCSDGDAQFMELHEQSWGDGVGWYTQSRVRIDSQQLPFIRQALGGSTTPGSSPNRAASLGLRVIHADSA